MATNFITPDLMPALPEIFLMSMACIILVADLFLEQDRRIVTHWMSMGTLVILALITMSQNDNVTVSTFGGMYIADGMAHVLKLVAYATMGAIFIYSKEYLEARNLFQGEFYTLGLFALLGVMVMISAHHFVVLYLGLELLSLSLYGLVAMQRDNGVASEAAMKYFILGAIASGFLLYGMSILYGVTGALGITEVAAYVSSHSMSVGLVLGVVFVVAGLAFKLGAVPFHMWVPDVYDGAPTAMTLMIGTVPKLGGFALFMRLLADGLGDAQQAWQLMLIVLSVASMAIGATVAIVQTSMKRLLAYSTISHVGFILLGILAGTEQGYEAAMFYTIIYVIMSAAGFGMILLLARNGFEADQVSDFAGLARRSPWFAAMMMFVMFGMAGVPPFAGFFAKFEVIRAVLDVDLLWLAIAAVVFSVISAYYYLKVVKVMYFDEPEGEILPLEAAANVRTVMTVNGLLILGLGIFPNALMTVCMRAIGY
ncbi:MAG: NADH-quinone oxidoreductase subunit NuoN [Gammaproteobacteria bacterium]|nr:NADH-quinone oxidoreductase subunit NuoN [Gammaproteobacteria bacterium]